MEFAVTEPIIFRNNRFMVGMFFVVSILCFVMSPCFLIVALTELFPLQGFTTDRAISIVIWLVLAVVFLSRGAWAWRVGRNMAHNQVRLDIQGVHFLLEAKKDAPEQSLAWDQIERIGHKRLANNQYYAVFGKDGRVFGFTALSFIRPKKLARQIAAGCGKTIEELK
jgi:hypothetical protein